MRTCASCGKANNPTRKFCLRCGKPLYPDKETKQPAAQPISSNGQGVQRAVKQLEKVVSPSQPPPTTPTVTTEDKWVKPSEVSRDRIRTTSPTSGKSEMEKAREAFAKAEEVGIADENGEIVETRMLRASEVQELMQDLSKQKEIAPQAEQPVLPPRQTTQPSMSIRSSERTPPHQTPLAASSPTPVRTQVITEPEPVRHIESEAHQQLQQEERSMPPPQKPVIERAPRTVPTTEDVVDTFSKEAIVEVRKIISEITNPEFLQDQIIKETANDLTNLHTEIRHYEADLSFISNRLEKESKDCWNKAEVKRIHFESLEEQLRLSKQEWTETTKVYQNAEKRRKDEISSREKHIKDLQKRISKTEDTIRKRVKELEKEKEKAEQQ